MISIEVYGADGKTSSPTKGPTSSLQNRTLVSLSDLSGVTGRREGTSILTTVPVAGMTMANLFGRTKSCLVCLISNADIWTRNTISQLGDIACLMRRSGVVSDGLTPNPIAQFGYGMRTEIFVILAAEATDTS